MMKTNSTLFNSVFEMSLRIMLLLSVNGNKYYSAEQITFLDFINCYSEDYDLPFANLHGTNNQKLAELANRRSLTYESIKSLVTKGLIDVEIQNGYRFAISNLGIKYVKSLESDYAKEYKTIALSAIRKYEEESNKSLLDVTSFILSKRGK